MEYDALATGIRNALVADPGALSAERLARITPEEVQAWLSPHVLPNIEERVAKVREVGEVLLAEFDGLAINLIKRAKNSAVALVRLLTAHFPGFRDEAVYHGRQVFFYKRAQIFAADVWGGYGRRLEGDSPFAFPDIHRLTCFPDYRLPQLLRARGVMEYSQALGSTVDLQGEVPPGSDEEIEIRAVTVVVVEQMRAALAAAWAAAAAAGAPGSASAAAPAPAVVGRAEDVSAVEIDWYLWQAGEKAKDDLLPHHRTNTMFY
jgi:hypothetical protein